VGEKATLHRQTPPTLEERKDAYREERGIDAERFDRAGIRAVDKSMARALGYPAHDGIIIPYIDPLKDELLETQRIRYFDPPTKSGKVRRYSQLAGTPVEAYFDPNVLWAKVFKNPKVDLYITEGEMKAIAANQHGFVTIALGGVDSFGGDNLTPLLQKIVWKGRKVFIVYDSDAATKENVLRAERKLAEVLS
jgi:hypothetical protein